MKIQITEFDTGISYFTLSGVMLGDSAAELQLAVARTVKNGQHSILFDLADVTTIDTSGLKVIETVSDFVERFECHLRILNAPDLIQKLFNVHQKTNVRLESAA